MDPTEALNQLRDALNSADYARQSATGTATEVLRAEIEHLRLMADIIEELDEWLSNGGFTPGQWRPGGRLIRMD